MRHAERLQQASEPDAVAVRVVARVRIAAALIAAATGSFLPHLSGRERVVFLILGLGWTPAASVVLFAADAKGSPLAVFGGPVIDIAMLASIHALLPAGGGAALLGYVAVVAFAAYTGGKTFGALLGLGAMAVTVVVRDVGAGGRQIEVSTLLLFAVVLAALVFLLDRTAALQARTAVRSARFEGKADAILERVADGVVVTDGAGRVLQWSPAAERILGKSASEAVGLACHEIAGLCVGERRLDCSKGCPLLTLDQANGDALGQEAWRRDRDGRRQPLLVNASAVLGPDGSPVEVVHSLRDVTRLKQAEEAKTLFLATASHELKTPLAVIAGFSATLLSNVDLDDETRKLALEAVNRRAGELSRIVDRLLLSSRIEAGRVQVTKAPVDVAPLVAERTEAVRASTGHNVLVDVQSDAPPAVGDQAAVITIVDHLLDNAIKYSPGRGPVRVSVWADDAGVNVAVQDAGIGMDTEQAQRCFDKFWQAESSDVRRFGGTGIGLYIVRSLVEAMGGRIAVESEKGVGTTFTVTLHQVGVEEAPPEDEDANVGERTSIREFMRQIGVPERVK